MTDCSDVDLLDRLGGMCKMTTRVPELHCEAVVARRGRQVMPTRTALPAYAACRRLV